MSAERYQEDVQDADIERGLESQEAEKRRSKYGYNEIPEKTISFWKTAGKRFWGVVPWMLEATIVLTLLLGKYIEALIIIALLVFNAVMSQWREGRAKAAMTMLKQRLNIESRAKRDGKWIIIPARELVPGDVVRVRIGDILPADIKIVEGSVSLDQSILTGESDITDRSIGEIAYSGSAIKRGEATGTVSATGTKTYFGKTISLIDLAKPKLHMEEVTVKVARRLGLIVFSSLLVVFIYAGLTGFQLAVLLPLAVVLMIAIVPVAMPTMFTINMALGSLDLAKRGVLVTRLSASEDAATMDVLCLDKTGTITMNKLFVEEQIPLSGYNPHDVLLYGALASKEANQDPIDLAFLTAAKEVNIELNAYSQIQFVPFDPRTRMTEAEVQTAQRKFYVGKGSLNELCDTCQIDKHTVDNVKKIAESLSEKGLRVIAVAKGVNRSSLQLVGLAGIADRVREDSREVLDQIRDLGVNIKMLTGDSMTVAKNIAQKMGLGKNVTTMPILYKSKNTEIQYNCEIEDCHGIAQVYPEDKFTIVKCLQDAQHVVGMTGDGVNDAPALAQAEVGIAVENASDIAKDSASVVLTVEGLGKIIPMIKTSRAIYQRIYSWTLQMITRKMHIAFFILVMIFFTQSLILSLTSTLLILFLADFATMSMATDNVRFSLKPDKFSVRTLFWTGTVLGILMTIESSLFAIPLLSYFGMLGDIGKIYTFGFAYINFAGIFTIMILRERGHFWESKPSTALTITILAEILVVSLISIVGILELVELNYYVLFSIITYTLLTTFLVNDPIKVYLLQKLKETH